jgi:putative transposase
VDHSIESIGPMKRRRLNRLSPAKRAEVNRQLKDVMDGGLIRPNYSEFGSPIHFMRKADGSLRVCIDYRELNEVTCKDAYPLSRDRVWMTPLMSLRTRILTHILDLASGFWQVRVRYQDVQKTAFQTLDGLMEWVAMPSDCAMHQLPFI